MVADTIHEVAQILTHQLAEGAVAGDELLDVLEGIGRMPVEQLGQPHVRAIHLVDRELVQTKSHGVEAGLHRQAEHVPGDAVLSAQ